MHQTVYLVIAENGTWGAGWSEYFYLGVGQVCGKADCLFYEFFNNSTTAFTNLY